MTRRRVPWWLFAFFHGLDLTAWLSLPVLSAWDLHVNEHVAAPKAIISGMLGFIAALRLWLKQSPLVVEYGLRAFEESSPGPPPAPPTEDP